MKKGYKILSLALASTLALGVGGTAIAEISDATNEETAKIYLVAGSYTDAATGESVGYEVTEKATKLTAAQCDDIHASNTYLFDGKVGDSLPMPSTEREGYTFNGWWGIKDATITYYDTAPQLTQDLYLYADFRAELSQHKDPIVPIENEQQDYLHYLEITRAETGKTEKIQLFVSGTDVPNAVQAGYGGPVQFYNEWFTLQPGDMVRVYVSNVYGAEPTLAPQYRSAKKVTMESGWLFQQTDVADNNDFSGDYANSIHGEPRMLYTGRQNKSSTAEPQEHHFRIYIKFYDNGGTMTVYAENQDK